jgi:hypothetical protein
VANDPKDQKELSEEEWNEEQARQAEAQSTGPSPQTVPERRPIASQQADTSPSRSSPSDSRRRVASALLPMSRWARRRTTGRSQTARPRRQPRRLGGTRAHIGHCGRRFRWAASWSTGGRYAHRLVRERGGSVCTVRPGSPLFRTTPSRRRSRSRSVATTVTASARFSI